MRRITQLLLVFVWWGCNVTIALGELPSPPPSKNPSFDSVTIGGANAMVEIESDYVFADTTARDAYFSSNPAELTDKRHVIITGTGVMQRYDLGNTTWIDVSVVAQGPKGDTGDPGAAGADGANAYVYIAWASDDSGTGFTTTFNASLDYIAILPTDTEIASPQASDFEGLWKNYKGATGVPGEQGAIGPAGPGGNNVYVAWASDASGTGFTTTFDADLDYIGILSTITEIETLQASDFTGLWKNYKGATGDDGEDCGGDGSFAALTEDESPGDTDLVILELAADGTKRKVQVSNLPGGGTGTDSDAIHDNVAGEIVAVTEKTTPADNDELLIEDSADSNNKKSLKIGNIWANSFKAKADLLYASLTDLSGSWASPGAAIGTGTPVAGTFTTVTAATYQSSAADGSRISYMPENTNGNEPTPDAGTAGFYFYDGTMKFFWDYTDTVYSFADFLVAADVDTWAEHPSLTSAYILVGNGSNQPAAVAMSGDVAIANDGATTIQANAVDASMISTMYAYDNIPVAWMKDGTSAPDDIDDTTRDPFAYRTFASDADEDLTFVWFVPSDLSGSTIQFRVKYLITNATGPSASEGVAFGLSGISVGDNDATNGAKGTVVVVTDDELNAAQHDVLITGWSGDVTITNIAAGELAECALIRDVSDAVDDYGQVVGVISIEIRYVKNPA